MNLSIFVDGFKVFGSCVQGIKHEFFLPKLNSDHLLCTVSFVLYVDLPVAVNASSWNSMFVSEPRRFWWPSLLGSCGVYGWDGMSSGEHCKLLQGSLGIEIVVIDPPWALLRGHCSGMPDPGYGAPWFVGGMAYDLGDW